MKNELATFSVALQFLTRLPSFMGDAYTPERMAGAVRYYPLVGAIIGGLSALLFVVGDLVLPHTVAIVLMIAGGLLLTGAFHEDGLADTMDGVGGGVSRDDALAIMKDSRVGTYGALALVVVVVLKIAALAAMTPAMVCIALIMAHSLSRLSSVVVIATSNYVRDEGAAKPVAGGVSSIGFAVAAASGTILVCAGLLFQPIAAIACAVAGLVIGHIAMRLFYERKLGGYTGDALGAVQQASEIGFYLGLLAWV